MAMQIQQSDPDTTQKNAWQIYGMEKVIFAGRIPAFSYKTMAPG